MASAVWNQKVRKPVSSARRVLLLSPAEKCTTTVIHAFGRVEIKTLTVLPMMGRLLVTDALIVSGVGVGVGVAVAVAVDVAAEDAAVGCVDVQPPVTSMAATTAPVAAINRRVRQCVRAFPPSWRVIVASRRAPT